MAVAPATVQTVDTIKPDRIYDRYQVARILFTVAPSNVYAQADNGILQSVATLIQNSRRNGKTVTLRGTPMLFQHARKNSNPARLMGLKTLAIATNDITFEITEGATDNVPEYSTELANGAVPEQTVPFGILVGFEES